MKHKVVIHPRHESSEKPVRDGTQIDLEDAIRDAGWSDDPGVGHAVLMHDGREVLNPTPIAPPVGFVEGPSLLEQFEEKMAARFRMLQEDQEIDTLEEFEDFDVPEDQEPDSPYTVVMHDEFPSVPPADPAPADLVPASPADPAPADPVPAPVKPAKAKNTPDASTS